MSREPDFGDRAWAAYMALPRDEFGAPPPTTALERMAKPPLPRGILGKIFHGRQKDARGKTLERIAAALRTTPGVLTGTEGPVPRPSGPFRARPRKFNDQGEPVIVVVDGSVTPEAFAVGATSVLPSGIRSKTIEVLIREYRHGLDEATRAVDGLRSYDFGPKGPTVEQWARLANALVIAAEEDPPQSSRTARELATGDAAAGVGHGGNRPPKTLPAKVAETFPNRAHKRVKRSKPAESR